MNPERPNLDYLRKAAKDLKRAVARGEPSAVARLAAVLPQAGVGASLADCLHVIAREAGYESWPKLKSDVELRQASRSELAGQLGAALYYGRLRHAARILAIADDPGRDSLALQFALYQEERVHAAIEAAPERAMAPEKVVEASAIVLDPLTRVCTSQFYKLGPDLADTQTRMVRHLLALGADPNVRHPWPDDPSVALPLLYGTLCVAGNLALAEVLLEAGADPNDGECAYHASEMETLDGLRLLFRYGLRLEGTNALFRMLDFDNHEGAELLLANGADPNEHLGHGGGALRHAIRRGRDGRFADLLLRHGADAGAEGGRHSAYALAAIHGNRSMMDALERHGLKTELDHAERLLAAVAAGRRGEALALWAQDKDIVSRLSPFDQRLHLAFAAQPGRREALELMNEVGFDPAITDSEGMTALMMAAWHGRAENVGLYLSGGPDKAHRNRYGGTALGTAIHGSANCPGRSAGNHLETVRLLVEAGFAISPDEGHLAIGSDAVTAYLEDRLAEARNGQSSG